MNQRREKPIGSIAHFCQRREKKETGQDDI